MLIKRRAGWEMPESQATSESVYMNRRALLAGTGALALASAAPAFAQGDPTGDLYPAKRNAAYTLDRPLSAEDDAANYNHFYEFGMS